MGAEIEKRRGVRDGINRVVLIVFFSLYFIHALCYSYAQFMYILHC